MMNNAKEVQDNYMDNLYNLIEEEKKRKKEFLINEKTDEMFLPMKIF